MQAGYVRLFTDEDGGSRFENKDIALAEGYAVPPADPLHVAEFFATGRSFWIGAPANWKGDAAHPAPARQIFVTVSGEYEVTASDGTVRRFPPGSVLVLEDVSGRGHSTRITSPGDCIIFAVALSDDA